MTAISTPVDRPCVQGDLIEFPMLGTTAQTIPKGALVMNDATGYAVNAADTNACVFLGVADETKTSPTGATNGDVKIDVRRKGAYKFTYAGSAGATLVGTIVCAVDNNTVDIAGDVTNRLQVGRVSKVESATLVWVEIDEFVGVPALGPAA